LSTGHILSILFAFVIVFSVMAFLWSRVKGDRRKVSPEAYIDALKALLAGRQQVAFQRFKEVAKTDPDNVDAFLKLGDLFRDNKRYDKALQIHKELTLRPSLTQEQKSDISKSLAEDYSVSGNHDKAILVLEELYKTSDKDERIALKLLSEYEETQRWEEAFELRKKLSGSRGDINRKILALYKVLWGKARADRGELHKARVAYKEALNYDETCVPAYVYLGEAYYQDERLKEAVEYWKKLLEAVPDAGYLVYDRMEKALFELGEYSDIPDVYENVLSTNPSNTLALFSLARIDEKKGMIPSAVERYKQILDLDPSFFSAKLSLARLYLQERRNEEAMEILERLTEKLSPTGQQFICQKCGHKSSQPLWRCPSCRLWNSFNISKP
jgi:lipopolysaccharide biosynthesis regulator YciM